MGADPDLTTAVGISSGTYMAMQMLVVHSDWMHGAGLLLGGSYGTNEFLKKVSDIFTENLKQDLTPEEQKTLLDLTIDLAK